MCNHDSQHELGQHFYPMIEGCLLPSIDGTVQVESRQLNTAFRGSFARDQRPRHAYRIKLGNVSSSQRGPATRLFIAATHRVQQDTVKYTEGFCDFICHGICRNRAQGRRAKHGLPH